uniref:ANK_REP_REGION domain-containing protein n=1 Tax=Macrostomum lignano TaxID=282301 RepID=A0A1I8F5X9_9PLAT
ALPPGRGGWPRPTRSSASASFADTAATNELARRFFFKRLACRTVQPAAYLTCIVPTDLDLPSSFEADFAQMRGWPTRQLAENVRHDLFELGRQQSRLGRLGRHSRAPGSPSRTTLRLLTLAWLAEPAGATPLMAGRADRQLEMRQAPAAPAEPEASCNGGREVRNSLERAPARRLKDVDWSDSVEFGENSGDHSSWLADIERKKANRKQLSGHVWQLGRLCDNWPPKRGGYDLPDKSGRTAHDVEQLGRHGKATAVTNICGTAAAAADPTCADMCREPACITLAWSGNSVAASALLHSGASVNAKDDAAISLAVDEATISAFPVCRHRRVLSGSVDSGSDWQPGWTTGRTARDLARENGKAELEALAAWVLAHGSAGAAPQSLCSWSCWTGEAWRGLIDNKPLDEAAVRSFSKQRENTRIKLIDFGLSIKLEQSVSHISATTQKPEGTLNFMAPELLELVRLTDRSTAEIAVRVERSGAPAIRDGGSVELKDFYSQCTARNRIERKPADELMKHQFLAVKSWTNEA